MLSRIRISCLLVDEDTGQTAAGKMLLHMEEGMATLYIRDHDDPHTVHVLKACGGSRGFPQQVLTYLGLELPPQAMTG